MVYNPLVVNEFYENNCDFKAKLVAQAFKQVDGFDYDETFPLVALWF